MGKRFAIVIGVAAAGVMALGSQSAAAAPGGLNGTFRVHFPKGHPASNAPCPTDVFCGVGELVGYGKATITILDETFTEIPDSPCLDTTRVEAIDLIGSSAASSTRQEPSARPVAQATPTRGRTAMAILGAGVCSTRSTAARAVESLPTPPARGALDFRAPEAPAYGASPAN